MERGTSLLAAGVVAIEGSFEPEDPVAIATAEGTVFAKGLVRVPSSRASEWLGRRTADLADGLPHEIVHRDDLVVVS